MNKKIVEQIQARIIKLFPKDKKYSIGLFCRDSCSEMSRLVASWVQDIDKTTHLSILKGVNVCGSKKSHDILAVTDSNNNVYMIDPTIWQFFPDEKSILIGKYTSIDEAIIAVSKKYGGKWQKSEDLKETTSADKIEWLKIIKENSEETLNKNRN